MEWKIRKWKLYIKNEKAHKTFQTCRTSMTSKLLLFLKVLFWWATMPLAMVPSLEVSCLGERERGTAWPPAPLQHPALYALNHVSNNRVTSGWPPFQPLCLADISPEYVHWIPNVSAQPLILCWGGSSSTSSCISQRGYQRSPVSTGGLARHRRDGNHILQSYSDEGGLQCGLLLRVDF